MYPYSIPTDPAVIVDSPDDERDVFTGVQRIFRCSVTGNPLPIVTWYFNGELLEGDDQRMIAGDTLTIPSTAVEHSGMYQCVAENEFGVSAVESWTLQVRAPGMYLLYISTRDFTPTLLCHSLSLSLPFPLSFFSVTPMITASYNGDPDPCLGYHLIQQDNPPVDLVVTVTADPCPVATWYLNDTEITLGNGIEVSYPPHLSDV